MNETARVRVKLPQHLRNLIGVEGEALVDVAGVVTPAAVLAALEAAYPQLGGIILEHGTGKRRAYLRFFACQEDISHQPLETPLPEAVARGEEPFWVIGAISGG